ncbi:DNA cytosine methyltransferase [Streptomyces sp. NPDC020983]|uniref:DNA cytosine methyltransferase n=1 Tax=Streptomyces sp. NPDC020983 TaxID=3365106 RepID=UPI0037ABFA24
MIIDLFAGPGGLDLAARQLGVPSIGIEYDPDACDTRRAAGLATVEGDVRAYGPADFPDADVLAGGPPCQTFTVAGSGAGRRALDTVLGLAKRRAAREDVAAELAGIGDERTGLVLEPLRWALEAADAERPYRAIILEQVPQVPQVLPVWELYVDLLRAEGYKAACGVVRAEEYGAPQTRRRAVLLARRDGLVGMPARTHRPWGRTLSDAEYGLRPTVVMGDALPGRGGFTVISNYGTGGDPKKRGRRHNSEPAATVTGRINRNRLVADDGRELPRLTPAEAGALQGFPADYPWSGRDPWQQIGNAVPVPLGVACLTAALGVTAARIAPAA